MCAAYLHFRKVRKGRKNMKIRHCETLKATLETEGRFDMTKDEVFEMHLVDRNNRRERAICGVCAPDNKRMGMAYYLEMRKDGFGVGTVCQSCKALAMPLAAVILEDMAQDLEEDGWLGEAEDCRLLVDRLARETSLDRKLG